MEEPSPILETPSAQPEPARMSLAARLLNVFAIPGEVFEEVKQGPPSVANWLLPALMLVLVGCVGAYLIYSQPAIQQQMREAQEKIFQKMVDKGRITQEMADKQLEMSQVGNKISPLIGVVFYAFITPFWYGLIFWLAGKALSGGGFSYMKAVEVAGLCNTIMVLGSIIGTLLSVSLSSPFATAGPALLVKNFDPQKPSHALLKLVDVMAFWTLAVRSIGLARLARTSFLPAAIWVFGAWALVMGGLVGIGLAVSSLIGL